jgi:ATP-dependent DNA helicase RecG
MYGGHDDFQSKSLFLDYPKEIYIMTWTIQQIFEELIQLDQ